MATKVPSYTYTGASHSSEVKNGYWYIYLKSSGTLTMNYKKTNVEAFLVGGGGGGGSDKNGYGYRTAGGGGGGYCDTKTNITVDAGRGYDITVCDGGTGAAHRAGDGSDGKPTMAFGYTVAGGSGGIGYLEGDNGDYGKPGGNGGSGGGAGGSGGGSIGGNGGTDGSNGGNGLDRKGGIGQGTSTREFGEASGTLYAGGGGGALSGVGGSGGGGNGATPKIAATSGEVNAGGGGGGGYTDMSNPVLGVGGNGGSGIVILRGTQDDLIPVTFNNVQLSELIYNRTKVTSLIFNGTKLFARKIYGEVKRCVTFASRSIRSMHAY